MISWKGIPFATSTNATMLAEQIIRKVGDAACELVFTRNDLIEEVTRLSPGGAEEAARKRLQEIKDDIFSLLMGHDTGCNDPEDSDESNCGYLWIDARLAELLDGLLNARAELNAEAAPVDAPQFRKEIAEAVGVEPEELDDSDELAWLTGAVRAGRGAVTFCETEDGDIGVFLGEDGVASGTGDTATEAVARAAAKLRAQHSALQTSAKAAR